MFNGDLNTSGKNNNTRENFMVRLTEPMLYDRLHTLAAEYSMSDEVLVNTAVKRLIDDVEFVRELRTGNIKQE